MAKSSVSRRTALGLGASLALPRFAVAQSDQRPSMTIAVQKIATSNTLEPLREQSNVGQRIASVFAESLIEIDWLDTLQKRPSLATAWKQIDDRTLELSLREGVRLQNGDVLTAEDVAFSFGPERMWSGTNVGSAGMFASTTAGAATKTPPPEVPAVAKSAYPGLERVESSTRTRSLR